MIIGFFSRNAFRPAYDVAGLKALREKKSMITARVGGEQNFSGEQILVGNGKYYAGTFAIFPQADLHDGLLDICILPRVNLLTLLRCVPGILFRRKFPEKIVKRFRAPAFELTCESPAAFELDGEWIGHLPVKFSVERERLRVMVP